MIRSACPSCGLLDDRVPYDIGSGPELACAACETCWGANGQPLEPLDVEALGRAMLRRYHPTLAAEVDAELGFACPRCGRTSHHPDDVAAGYCGACHDWTAHASGAPSRPDLRGSAGNGTS